MEIPTDVWGQLALEASQVYLGDGVTKRSPFADTTIEKLPDKVLLKVFSYLSHREICRMARVCRKWRTIAYDTRLWRHVSLRPEVSGLHVAISIKCYFNNDSKCQTYSRVADCNNVVTIRLQESRPYSIALECYVCRTQKCDGFETVHCPNVHYVRSSSPHGLQHAENMAYQCVRADFKKGYETTTKLGCISANTTCPTLRGNYARKGAIMTTCLTCTEDLCNEKQRHPQRSHRHTRHLGPHLAQYPQPNHTYHNNNYTRVYPNLHKNYNAHVDPAYPNNYTRVYPNLQHNNTHRTNVYPVNTNLRNGYPSYSNIYGSNSNAYTNQTYYSTTYQNRTYANGNIHSNRSHRYVRHSRPHAQAQHIHHNHTYPNNTHGYHNVSYPMYPNHTYPNNVTHVHPIYSNNTFRSNAYPTNALHNNHYPNMYPNTTYPNHTHPNNTHHNNAYPDGHVHINKFHNPANIYINNIFTYPNGTYPNNTYPNNTYPNNTYPNHKYPNSRGHGGARSSGRTLRLGSLTMIISGLATLFVYLDL